MKRFLLIINRLEEGVLAFGLLGLAFMAFIEVVTRYVFSYSFTWFEEFARYFCVFLTFLGASLGVKYGMHFSMDFVVTRVGSRTGRVMRLTSALISAVLFFTVAWLAWEHAGKMRHFGATSAAMGLPMFWAYLPIALFSFILALRFVHQAWLQLQGVINNTPLVAARAPDEGEDAS